ncbi:uncharacterized protein LOC134695782 isoform X1 [Mytilus trossulus]|uniref:uncharacterized protein LOC134695782 isoform X1 n=1 Tax=Mytilus trossulus TaxID=6551 RepID=UPI0030054B25
MLSWSSDRMTKMFAFVAFIQLAIVTSLRKNKPVSITLNAGKEIPISGFLIGNSESYLFKKEMDYQLNKMKTVSKDNSDSISAIKSSLTDITKVVNGLLKAAVKQPNYGYIGCYKDDNNRHLKHKQSNIGNSITLAKCRELCKGYKYTGLQYRIQCSCGNVLKTKCIQEYKNQIVT